MGCGASDARATTSGSKRYAMQKRPDEPELNGKAKFLSCPVVTDLVHPDTKDRWFVIVFAPLGFYGLTIAARNVTNGVTLLAKEVTDQQLAREKEEQSITMSWNLFFKAMASEMGKANKSGARAEFNKDGSLTCEIRIAIAGAVAQARKADQYKFTLTEVDNSPANVFRLLMEPVCTYFSKKKTDLADRPDPAKEKTLGDLEAATVIRMANITSARSEIESYTPVLEPLRTDSEKLRLEADQQMAKALLGRCVATERTDTPAIVLGDPFVGPFARHIDPEAPPALSAAPAAPSAAEVIATACGSVPRLPDPAPAASTHAIVAALAQIETCPLAALGTHLTAVGAHAGLAAAYLLRRVGGDEAAADCPAFSALCGFFAAVDAVYATQPTELFGARRVATSIALLLRAVVACDPSDRGRLAATPREWTALVVAASVAVLGHPGQSNMLQRARRTFLSTLYAKRSPVQRHAVARALEIATEQQIALPTAEIANFVVATDAHLDPPFEDLVMGRCAEIVDFSRTSSDRAIAAAMLLRAVHVAVLYGRHAVLSHWHQAQQERDRIEMSFAASIGVTHFSARSNVTAGEASARLTTVLPSLAADFTAIFGLGK